MATYVRASNGTWKSGADWALVQPRVLATRSGVLWCHGGGGAGATAFHTPLNPNRALIHAVAEHFPILVVNDVGSAMGNSADQADIASALTFLHAQEGVSAGPVACIGVSQGNLAAMNYARNNPGTISCIAGIIPAVDLDDVRDNDRGGFRSVIDAAWGVTWPTALPVGANPMDYPPTGTPWKAWYSDWDDIVVEATVLAMATTLGAEAVDVGDMGHSEQTVGQVPPADVVAFLKANT